MAEASPFGLAPEPERNEVGHRAGALALYLLALGQRDCRKFQPALQLGLA